MQYSSLIPKLNFTTPQIKVIVVIQPQTIVLSLNFITSISLILVSDMAVLYGNVFNESVVSTKKSTPVF